MPLSVQQYKVLHALIKGHSYQQISEDLSITQSTVKYHARRIYINAGVKTRSQLMARLLGDMLESGWVEKMLDKYHEQNASNTPFLEQQNQRLLHAKREIAEMS